MTSETPRPDFWGGYSFIPYYFEFWQGHENRLNKRHVFEQQDDRMVGAITAAIRLFSFYE